MRVAAINWCSEIPGLQVYLFRRLSDDLAKNHLEGPKGFENLLAEWKNDGWCKITHNPGCIEFWNGSKIFLCHCQYEKDMYKYQGAEIHVLLMDELTHFTEKIYRYLRGRVRMVGIKLPEKYEGLFPRIIACSNPGGIGHNWVKLSFIDLQQPYEIMRMGSDEGGFLRQFIPSLYGDNPSLLKDDPEYKDRLSGLGSPELVRAMLEGDWNIVSGGMFDDLWRPDVHILEPFKIPAYWRIRRAFDWGSSRPFSVGWWAKCDGTEVLLRNGELAWFPPGTRIRIAEWYGWTGKANEGLRMTPTEVAKGIVKREKEMGYRIKPGPADSAMWAKDRGNNAKAIIDYFKAEGIDFVKSEKGPGSRITRAQLVRDAMQAALQHPMEKSGLFVFNNCRQFIRTVPTLTRDVSNPEDVDTDGEDHAYDETGYELSTVEHSGGMSKLQGVY